MPARPNSSNSVSVQDLRAAHRALDAAAHHLAAVVNGPAGSSELSDEADSLERVAHLLDVLADGRTVRPPGLGDEFSLFVFLELPDELT